MLASANRLVPVAKILKSFGTEGALLVRFHNSYREQLEQKRPVFIIYDKLPVPFFISSFKKRGDNQAIIELRGIYNNKLSEEVKGRRVYLDYIELEKDDLENHEKAIGYKVYNQQRELLGEVLTFYNFPGNPCYGVGSKESGEELFLLPIHPDIILKESKRREEFTVELPIGLQEL